MDFRFSAEQCFIRDNARDFLREQASVDRRRAALGSDLAWDRDLWRGMGQEMGWAGVALPEAFGGSGLGLVELAILMQETGRVLAMAPFFTSAGLCAPAIQAIATEAQQAQLLPPLADGSASAAFCLTGASGAPAPLEFSCILERCSGQWRLSGEAHFVAFADSADFIMAAARLPGTTGWDGLSVITLPARTAGLEIRRVVTMDLTRPYSVVRFNDVAVSEDSLLGEVGRAGDALRRSLAVSASLLAAEQLGGAEYVLEMTVEYTKQRVQFGRIIGSFQAVKHSLADMMLLVESARSAAYYAACTAGEFPDELEEASAIARSTCSDAFLACAGQAIQLHGGIGFTWEHEAHLYFKRARAASTMLGDATHHREKLASLIGLDHPSTREGPPLHVPG